MPSIGDGWGDPLVQPPETFEDMGFGRSAPPQAVEAGATRPEARHEGTGLPSRTSSGLGKTVLTFAGIAVLCAAVAGTIFALTSWWIEGGQVDAALVALVAVPVAFIAGRLIHRPGAGASAVDRPTSAAQPPATQPPLAPSESDGPRSGRGSFSRLMGALFTSGRPRAPSPIGATPSQVREMRSDGRGDGRYRRHARIRPRHRSVVVITGQGLEVLTEILDVSQSGVALGGTIPGVWIGCMVTVGSHRAKAVRTLPGGMAFEFSIPISAEALHAQTVL